MSFIKIICARPGFWRAGVAHDAVKIWPAGTFSAGQLECLRAEPLLTVTEITNDEAARAPADSPPAAFADSRVSTVAAVLRLFAVSQDQLEDMTAATLAALDKGMTSAEFKPIAMEIYENTPEGRSGTAREAPSAGSGPEGEASAEPEGGALPAAPLNTEGAAPADAVAPGGGEDDTSPPPSDAEGGEGAEGKAQSPSEPAPAPKTSRKAKAH